MFDATGQLAKCTGGRQERHQKYALSRTTHNKQCIQWHNTHNFRDFYKAGIGVASILRTLWKHSLLTFDVLEGGIRIKTIGYDAVLLTMVCCKRRLGVSAFLLVLSWQQIVAL